MTESRGTVHLLLNSTRGQAQCAIKTHGRARTHRTCPRVSGTTENLQANRDIVIGMVEQLLRVAIVGQLWYYMTTKGG